MVKLHFKFKEHISKANRDEVISLLGNRGAQDVRPLFPGEADKELASLYIVDCQDDILGRELMGLLSDLEVVEFAEEGVRRKLIP